MKMLLLSGNKKIELTDSEAEAVKGAIMQKEPVYIPRLEMTISSYDIKRLYTPEIFLGKNVYKIGSDSKYYYTEKDNNILFACDDSGKYIIKIKEAEELRKLTIPIDEWLVRNKNSKSNLLK